MKCTNNNAKMVLPPPVPKAQIKFELHKINLKYASLMLVVTFPCNSCLRV